MVLTAVAIGGRRQISLLRYKTAVRDCVTGFYHDQITSANHNLAEHLHQDRQLDANKFLGLDMTLSESLAYTRTVPSIDSTKKVQMLERERGDMARIWPSKKPANSPQNDQGRIPMKLLGRATLPWCHIEV
jgi:hypothetical protein